MVKFYKQDFEMTISEYQDACFDILRDIVKCCNDNQINFWLEGGTLLGLIRHNDFIPWDDDIDISMDKKNYIKFMQISPSYFKNKYEILDCSNSYSSKGTMKVVGNSFTMIDSRKYQLKYEFDVFVDIFMSDDYYVGKLSKIYIKLSRIVELFLGYPRKPSLVNTLAYLIGKPAQLFFKIVKFCMDTLLPKNGTGLLPVSSPYTAIQKKSDVFPLKYAKWRDLDVLIPNNPEGFLTTLFGANYMQLPPENNRKVHAAKILKN